MELLGFLVAAVVMYVVIYRVNTRDHRASKVAVHVDPKDEAELDAIAQQLLWERLTQRSAPLAGRLRTILSRKVPARGLTPVADEGYWVLLFADGGGLKVTSRRRGDLTDLLVGLARGRATLMGHSFDGDDFILEFATGPRLVRVVALAEA
ncbi:MAG: hypothetical protein ACLGHZ_01435 [Actinomycetes bacterium]